MTISILAYDPEAKLIGSAVLSDWPSCGGVVHYFRPGVGMVNIQNMADAQIAEFTLSELSRGALPDQAIAAASAKDISANIRQMIVMDIKGHMFGYTGKKCVEPYGVEQGDNVIVAGHSLPGVEVLTAGINAFTSAEGNLATRLLQAMEHMADMVGEGGFKAAALNVCHVGYPQQRFYPVDLRVDYADHSLLPKMRRLLNMYMENERRGIGVAGW